MKSIITSLLLCCATVLQLGAQDSLWIRFDNRFLPNQIINISNADSLSITTSKLNVHRGANVVSRDISTLADAATFSFSNPGRYLYKPSTYASNDYTDPTARWSFERSMESEHFVVFWEKEFGTTNVNFSGLTPSTMLSNCERIWQVYIDQLGFLEPGKSTTDKYKIEIYVLSQAEWRADGSGVDGQVGLLHVNAWAATSRGGHTVAHEIGHTFQYLVSCDIGQQHGFNYGYGDGASGGNGWWESCANWQAYKCYPTRQFTDGEYFEGYIPRVHLNLLHESMRYENCFIHDWWCEKHGQDFIGRLWRESNKPEDPVEAYKRLCGLTQAQFNDEMFEGVQHMATWDIPAVRDAAAHRIGQHRTYLHLAAQNDGTWEVDSAYCPQNYGYSIINMNNITTAGTVVKAHFKGIAGAAGYRAINTDRAGWRYGFVALTSNGTRVYGEAQSAADGTATLTVPANCQRIFFCVMGAPTAHWRHPWDANAANDEQLPYQVKFENINIAGK
jgi:hypothetical protein